MARCIRIARFANLPAGQASEDFFKCMPRGLWSWGISHRGWEIMWIRSLAHYPPGVIAQGAADGITRRVHKVRRVAMQVRLAHPALRSGNLARSRSLYDTS
jgi:hypothetical protein